MRLRFPRLAPAILLISALALAGCESSEERAEKFYQSGMKLLEAGDVDRALVEFRNVFKLNGQHKEARLAYAKVQRERGKTGDAFGQYMRLVEQYPDLIEARLAMAEIAIETGNWEEAERNGRALRDIDPKNPAVVVVNATLDYRKAVLDKDPAAARDQAAIARKVLESDPSSLLARRLVVEDAVAGGDKAAALAEAQAAVAAVPKSFDFQMIQLKLLNESGDVKGTTEALEAMAAQFPEKDQVRQMLIGFYVERGNLDGAETYLRKLAAEPAAKIEAKLSVVEFLRRTKGIEAAKTELDSLIAADAGNKTYKALRAAIVFEEGDTGQAITDMEGLLKDTEATDEMRNLKVALARMLEATGNSVGARARVEEVLAEDPNQVEALKMRAAWLIAEDKPGDAVLALRTALAQAPRDVSVITMMAEAHERDGARELAGERYALAVEVSGRAPAESLRYVGFLLADGKTDAAETVLTDAMTAAPQNIDLLAAMAEVQLRKRDWDRVTRIIWQLRAIGSDAAKGAANGIEAEFLLRQERVDDTLAFLEGIVAKGDAGTAAKARMVQIQVRDGRLAEASTFLDAELAKTPDEPALRFLRAGLYVLENKPDEAEKIYRALFDASPSDQTLQALYGLLSAQNRGPEAEALIDTVLAANPTAVLPRLIRATALERKQDFEGAITVYESLYTEDSSNLVVANNLASLITAQRSDPESLERAFAIARRLRGTEVPAFQDTYGWIEYRRGNYDEALKYLEPAAKGLPDDPLTQVHLGLTYVALKRMDEARATLTAALALAGDNPLPQFTEARKVLAGLAQN
jgi:cellulose synthase operon protein C